MKRIVGTIREHTRDLGALWGSLGLALAVLIAAAGTDAARLMGRYDRAGLAAGELWRLVSGHLVHLNGSHTGMNLASLAVMSWLFGRFFGALEWLSVCLVAALAVDIGLYWGEPQLVWYVGLSGVLHGLWAAGALRSWSHAAGGAAITALLVGKLVWEQWQGALPFSAETAQGPVVVAAHLYGALGGLAWILARRVIHRTIQRPL